MKCPKCEHEITIDMVDLEPSLDKECFEILGECGHCGGEFFDRTYPSDWIFND